MSFREMPIGGSLTLFEVSTTEQFNGESVMIIRKGLLLICFILTSLLPSRADAIDPMPTKVAILIRPSLWQSLQSEITDYMADVCTKEAVEFEVVRENFETPQQVRSVLERLWKDKGIEGAILIGSLPMHQFFMHEHANPNPLYFEDFSLQYRDEDSDGVSESYTGQPQLKIWVANIRASERPDDDDLDGLRRYFRKLKQYYAGRTHYENRSIIVTDAELGMRSDEAELGRFLFGASGVRLLATPKNTLTEFRSAFRDSSYAICTMGVHSDWAGQELEQENSLALRFWK